jgi:hypothetical protein
MLKFTPQQIEEYSNREDIVYDKDTQLILQPHDKFSIVFKDGTIYFNYNKKYYFDVYNMCSCSQNGIFYIKIQPWYQEALDKMMEIVAGRSTSINTIWENKLNKEEKLEILWKSIFALMEIDGKSPNTEKFEEMFENNNAVIKYKIENWYKLYKDKK